MGLVKINSDLQKILFRLVIVSPWRVSSLGLVPQVLELWAAALVLGPGYDIVAADPNTDSFQVHLCHLLFPRHQNTHHLIRADELLGQGYLEQAGHKHRHVHVTGNIFLKVGKVTTFGGDGPAAHFFQLIGCLLDRLQTG